MIAKKIFLLMIIITVSSNLSAAWIQTIENKTPYTVHITASWDLQDPIEFDLGAGKSRSFNTTDQELKYIRAFIKKPYQRPGAQSGYTYNNYETPYQGNGVWAIVGPFVKPYVGVNTWAQPDPLADEQFEVVRTK